MNSEYLKSLRLVYFALAAGIVLFLLVSVFLNTSTGAFMGNDVTAAEKTPFIIVLIVLTGLTFIAYKAIFPKKLGIIRNMTSLAGKLAAWRELNVLRAALIEAPSFMGIVLFMLLGIHALLIWPLAGLLLFWFTQPTRDKLVDEANFTSAEIKEFDLMK